jgi:hypothetical protein
MNVGRRGEKRKENRVLYTRIGIILDCMWEVILVSRTLMLFRFPFRCTISLGNVGNAYHASICGGRKDGAEGIRSLFSV